MLRRAAAFAAAILALAANAAAAQDALRLATTTSTENSGLLREILPKFEAATGFKVQVIAVGTGRALRLGENGEADVLLVHSRADEDRFVKQGYGLSRRDVMHNDFVLVGPAADPAGVRGLQDVVAALRLILDSRSTFVSRGDESGTHAAEKVYWRALGRRPSGRRYVSAGQGMGETLRMAAQLGAYSISDRGTFAAYRARTGLEVLVQGDPRMINPYGVIAVNPARFPEVNAKGAAAFVEWITGREGRRAISEFRVNGEQVFFTPP